MLNIINNLENHLTAGIVSNDVNFMRYVEANTTNGVTYRYEFMFKSIKVESEQEQLGHLKIIGLVLVVILEEQELELQRQFLQFGHAIEKSFMIQN